MPTSNDSLHTANSDSIEFDLSRLVKPLNAVVERLADFGPLQALVMRRLPETVLDPRTSALMTKCCIYPIDLSFKCRLQFEGLTTSTGRFRLLVLEQSE